MNIEVWFCVCNFCSQDCYLIFSYKNRNMGLCRDILGSKVVLRMLFLRNRIPFSFSKGKIHLLICVLAFEENLFY